MRYLFCNLLPEVAEMFRSALAREQGKDSWANFRAYLITTWRAERATLEPLAMLLAAVILVVEPLAKAAAAAILILMWYRSEK